MKKKIITVVLGIIAIILIVTVSQHDQNSQTQSNHQQSLAAHKWSKKSFDQLTLGDFNKAGKNGTSYEKVVATYGRPDKKSKSKANGHILTVVSWKNVSGDYTGVTLTFMSANNNTNRARLTSKTILDTKTINLAKKWTLSAYNAIALDKSDDPTHEGDSLKSLTSKYGKPAILTLARVNGAIQTNAVWHNTNGGANGTVSVDFSEQQTATDKEQDKLR